MIIKTSDPQSIRPFLENIFIPAADSHKGQNGRALIIGGSELFHAASLWAAEVATHFLDMVHYCSTEENETIFLNLKTTFRNGIVVKKEQLLDYVREDDSILLGPGMVRGQFTNFQLPISNFQSVLEIQDEVQYTYYLTQYLIENFPQKRFVFDAGALQMMEAEWLLRMKVPPILTPHQLEFERLFGVNLHDMPIDRKAETVKEIAEKYGCVIMMKAVQDIISDGTEVYIIEGGNQGLTKGGSGDVLAGLTTAFYTKNGPIQSAILASYLLKKTADDLFPKKGYWYNISEVLQHIPAIYKKLIYNEYV